MKKIYIAHPLRGADREKNVEEVTKICKKVVELFPDVLPVSPIHAFSFLDNCGAEGEKKALELCLAMVKECDEVWFFGRWKSSEGCQAEWQVATNLIDFSPEEVKAWCSCPVEANDKAFEAFRRWLLSEVYVEPELMPCPFCGGAAVLNTEYGFIACGNDSCFMTCSINWGNRAMDRVKTRAEAVAAWNRRAGE